MLTDKQVLEIFKKTGGVLKGHFRLTSGRHSDTYMQCAKLFIDTESSELLCKSLAEKITAKNIQIDVVISPAVGGILMGYEMARQLKKPNIFAERENGIMTLRRGFELKEGQNVLVVEDVVTTGGSVKEVITLAKEKGANVVAVASIVDRSNGNVDFGTTFVNLLSVEVLSYEAEECPICKKDGAHTLVKPGSRT